MGRRKASGRPINGWLVIDKAPEMTSTHVVNVVKRLTQAQKVGHGGTLGSAGDRRAADRHGRGDQDGGLHHGRAARRYGFALRFGRGARYRRRGRSGDRHQRSAPDRRRDPRGAAPVPGLDPAGSAAICGGQGPGRARLRHCSPRRERRAGAARDQGRRARAHRAARSGSRRVPHDLRQGRLCPGDRARSGSALGCHAHVVSAAADRGRRLQRRATRSRSMHWRGSSRTRRCRRFWFR